MRTGIFKCLFLLKCKHIKALPAFYCYFCLISTEVWGGIYVDPCTEGFSGGMRNVIKIVKCSYGVLMAS